MPELHTKKDIIMLGPVKWATPTPVGLKITGTPEFHDWEALGEILSRADRSLQWLIGDWLNFGEQHYGEMYAQALDDTKFSYQTLANMKSVATKVPMENRRMDLSYAHHRLVASLEPDEQKSILAKCADEKWSSKDLREHLKKQGKEPDAATLDCVGHPLPDKLVEVFARREEFRKPVAMLQQAIDMVAEIATDPIMAGFNPDEYQTHISNAINLLKGQAPHSVCAVCMGSGGVKGNCKPCHGRGYVGKTMWEFLPDNLKDKMVVEDIK